MLITVAFSIVVPLIYLIACAIDHRPGALALVPFMWLFMAILEYFVRQPVFVPSMLFDNMCWLIIAIFCSDYHNKAHTKNHVRHYGTIVAALMFTALIGIVINTSFSFKSTSDSIDSKVSTSKQAPSMHRGSTPIAISPRTVFYKVRNGIGNNVPHHNVLEIANDDTADTHGDTDQIQAQYFRNRRVFIVPIKYIGWLQYFRYHKIPGYFMVDATKPGANPHFVKKPINYGSNMYLGHNVDRMIYRAHPEYHQLDKAGAQLEVNNHKTPYNVETLYKPSQSQLWPRFNQLRVAIQNAQTGKIRFYKPKNTPKFADENLTSTFADYMNKFYGKYRHGWWAYYGPGHNGGSDPTEGGPEDGVTTIFNRNHTISYVTDFTTQGDRSSTDVGSSAINSRTGKLTYYHSNGLFDAKQARKEADHIMHRYHYYANNPVMYDIDGHPTWVFNMLDASDNQHFWLYEDNDADTSAYDKTPTETLDEFRNELVEHGGENSNSNAMKTDLKKGTVDRCAVTNGRVIFTLKGSKKVYVVKLSDNLKAALVHPNDSVKFRVGENGIHTDAHLTDSSLN